MTEIILIRHGETDWNAERRLQGHLDIALNAEGRRQAAALGRALQDEPLAAIISSDLQRAQHTAMAIASAQGMTVLTEIRLRERCYGAFEGLRYADIAERYPQDYLAWQSRDVDARSPGGVHTAETLREFSARVVTAIMRLAAEYEDQKIAVVAHGGVLECIYRHAHGIGLVRARDFEIRNASINRIVVNGDSMQVMQWSGVAHLMDVALDEIDQ